jgi:fatty-acyl-CoA synthase
LKAYDGGWLPAARKVSSLTEKVVAAEAEAGDPAERQHIADEIRQRVTHGSDVTLRAAQIVGPGWLLKTGSGKIARAANREKYLAERER